MCPLVTFSMAGTILLHPRASRHVAYRSPPAHIAVTPVLSGVRVQFDLAMETAFRTAGFVRPTSIALTV